MERMPQCRVFVFLALIITIHSAMAHIDFEIFTNDEHPGKCVIDTPKGRTIVDSFKSIQHPTKCARIECAKDGWALVYTCENFDPPKDCVNVDFPYCCERSDECNEV